MHGLVYSRQFVYLTAIFLSVLLSLFITSHIDVINPDGVCYLTSAGSMQFGLRQAMKVCDQAGWPFYAWIVAKLVAIMHISYVNAAFLLNTIFSALSVWFFLLIINFLAKPISSKTLLWFAAFVILLAKGFNDNRHYIVKDHGYWAFSLLAVLCCLYFIENRKWRYAFAWAGASILAVLFRVEGVIFLLCVPFLLWFDSSKNLKERFYAFLQMHTLNIIGLIGVLLFLWIYPQESLGRLQEFSWARFEHAAQLFQSRAQLLADHILNDYGQGDKIIVLSLTLLAWYFVYIITSLTLIYAVLIVYAWFTKCLPNSTRVIWTYIILNVAITFVFLIENMFLSKRYLVALCLMLIIWVPFALMRLFNHKSKKFFYAALIVIILFGIKSLVSFGYSKTYIRKAGEWIQHHVPASSTLYSNDILLMYYSKHFGKDIYNYQQAFKSNPTAIDEVEYVALRLNKKNKASIALNLVPIITFSNKRGDQVNIYRR